MTIYMRFYVYLILAFSVLLAGCSPEPDNDNGNGRTNRFGRFEGKLQLEPIDDEAGWMKLLAVFSYIDPDDEKWTAPKGYSTNGASIPKVFWSIVGSPFTGKYLKGAVIHDYYCEKGEEKKKRWRDVHTTFYYACRCGGVKPIKAKVIFGAVYHFGPRWPDPTAKAAATVRYSKAMDVALKNLTGFTDLKKKITADSGKISYVYDPKLKAVTFKTPKKVGPDVSDELKIVQKEFLKQQTDLFEDLKQHIEKTNPSLEAIEKHSFE